MKKLLNIVFITSVLLFTISCKNKKPKYQTYSFRQGKVDGCKTANGNFAKNRYLFTHNSQYALGWIDGEKSCQKRREIARVNRNLIVDKRSFSRGDRDGCTTANGNYSKNRYLFNNNQSYQNGWFYGRKRCNIPIIPQQ